MAADNPLVYRTVKSEVCMLAPCMPYTACMLLQARDITFCFGSGPYVIDAGLGALASAVHRVACGKTPVQFNRGIPCRIACRMHCNTNERVNHRCAAIQGRQHADSYF